MDSFLSDYSERFRYLGTETSEILDRLSDEALDWAPAEDANSAAVLITHMIGAARYWIGDVACGEQSKRLRDSEFTAKNIKIAELRESLEACCDYVDQKLSTLTVTDLAQERHSDSFGRAFTVGWCLLHALEHTATHVGHLHLLVDFYEQRENK